MAKAFEEKNKLIRCVCGEVVDLLKVKKCPSCGAKVERVEKKSVPIAAPAASSVAASKSEGVTKKPLEGISADQKLLFKKMSLAAGVVLLVAFMWTQRSIGSGAFIDRPPAGPGPVKFSQIMDKNLAAKWSLMMPGPNGTSSKWILDIRQDGTYSFNTTGQGPIGAHSGKIEADQGYWRLQSTTGFPWTDQGTYYFNGKSSMVFTGKLGSASWYRD